LIWRCQIKNELECLVEIKRAFAGKKKAGISQYELTQQLAVKGLRTAGMNGTRWSRGGSRHQDGQDFRSVAGLADWQHRHLIRYSNPEQRIQDLNKLPPKTKNSSSNSLTALALIEKSKMIFFNKAAHMCGFIKEEP
jgi:hypothetical protein